MKTPRELRDLYKSGANVSAHMRAERGLDRNTPEIIEIAYDLQAGSYVAAMADAEYARMREARARDVAAVISKLCEPESLLDAGVGEATLLSGVLAHLPAMQAYGFDLSWSRIAVAERWLRDARVPRSGDVRLCTGDLTAIPFLNDSIDVVYTSHAVEPNRGNEATILAELWRVARRFVVLIEPAYELASPEARSRMDSHGYCRDLPGEARRLGYEVLEHRLMGGDANLLNPSAITIIRKETSRPAPANPFACPRYKTELQDIGGMLFSAEALAVYPVIGGIPCLRMENAIFASRYAELAGGR